MIRASAGAAELGSVWPPTSACGPGVAAEPTPLPARRESSPCRRSRPRAHEAPARASALRRPAPPRCYKPDMATATLPFPSAGSRRRRRPRHSGTGISPNNPSFPRRSVTERTDTPENHAFPWRVANVRRQPRQTLRQLAAAMSGIRLGHIDRIAAGICSVEKSKKGKLPRCGPFPAVVPSPTEPPDMAAASTVMMGRRLRVV